MHVVIVYEVSGAGHRRMASILERALGSAGVEVTSVPGSALLGSGSGARVSALWNGLIRRGHLRTADVLVNGLFRSAMLPLLDVGEIDPLFAALDRLAPDLLVCTADGYNKALGAYARARALRFVVALTDIALYADLVSPEAVHLCYFEETAAAVRSFDFRASYFSRHIVPETPLADRLAYLVAQYRAALSPSHARAVYRAATGDEPRRNAAEAIVIGPIADPRFFDRRPRSAARQRFGGRQVPLVVVANGSAGGRFVVETTRRLARAAAQPIEVVALCGHDTDAYRALLDPAPGCAHVRPLPFERDMPTLLRAADVIVARPSAGLFVESLLSQTPFVAAGHAPSNDRGTCAILARHGGGEVAAVPGAEIGAIHRVLADRAAYVRQIDALAPPSTFDARAALVRRHLLGPRALPLDARIGR